MPTDWIRSAMLAGTPASSQASFTAVSRTPSPAASPPPTKLSAPVQIWFKRTEAFDGKLFFHIP